MPVNHGEQAFADVSNGNLLLHGRDFVVPDFGEGCNYVRTCDSREVTNEAKGWSLSPNAALRVLPRGEPQPKDQKRSGHPDRRPRAGQPGAAVRVPVQHNDESPRLTASA